MNAHIFLLETRAGRPETPAQDAWEKNAECRNGFSGKERDGETLFPFPASSFLFPCSIGRNFSIKNSFQCFAGNGFSRNCSTSSVRPLFKRFKKKSTAFFGKVCGKETTVILRR